MQTHNHLIRTASALALCLTTVSAWSASPSFDCAKATHEAEILICKDAELARLDRGLAELYALVLKEQPPE